MLAPSGRLRVAVRRAQAWPARVTAAVVACSAIAWPARAGDELRNWFNDPFLQISNELPDCPLPAGPFVDEAGRRLQAHRRAEKGTTCWLAHECERPQAYAYDADIAAAIEGARGQARWRGTSLWLTVQGRVVYIEGCATWASDTAGLEAFVRDLPHVQQAIAIVRSDATARAPYALRFAK